MNILNLIRFIKRNNNPQESWQANIKIYCCVHFLFSTSVLMSQEDYFCELDPSITKGWFRKSSPCEPRLIHVILTRSFLGAFILIFHLVSGLSFEIMTMLLLSLSIPSKGRQNGEIQHQYLRSKQPVSLLDKLFQDGLKWYFLE